MGSANFSGKVYVVTGGTQGIGKAVTLALAEAGAHGIVLCGRNRGNGAAVEKMLDAAGAQALYVHADLALPEDCRAVIAACDVRFGRLDGLVNVAGDNRAGGVEDASIDLWDHIFAVNVRAPFLLMQDAIALMRREGIQGSIVNVISMVSHGGNRVFGIYSISKGALATLTKNAAQTVRKDRIRINGLNPGWADTPGEHAAQVALGQPENWLDRAEAAQPFGQLIKPNEIARMCVFLLGPESGIMTGSLIDYDQNIIGAYDDDW